MRKLAFVTAAAVALLAMPASAAIIPTLQSVTPNGDGTFKWLYQGTLANDQGLTQGDRLVIYDFGGFVPGSFVNPYGGLLTATAELLSPPENAGLPAIGQSDDPSLWNLVFTYVGPPVNMSNTGGDTCCTTRDFNGIGASSLFSSLGTDGFSGAATKNDPAPGVFGTPTVNYGTVSVPVPAAVPEPGTWGLMLLGFGAVGMAFRRRPRKIAQLA